MISWQKRKSVLVDVKSMSLKVIKKPNGGTTKDSVRVRSAKAVKTAPKAKMIRVLSMVFWVF